MSEIITYKLKLECLAGRMTQENGKVKPDPRRGKIRIIQDDQDMTHFQWIDINTNNIEDDIVVFAFDSFTKVLQTKSRVYILEYSGERNFYWLQDPDSSKDTDLCKQIDDVIKNQEINDEQQVDPVPELPKPQNNNSLADIFAQFTQGRNFEKSPSLDKILTSEFLDSISQDPDLEEALVPLLPEGQNSVHFLRENLLSPQFKQALKVISHAVNSEAGAAVVGSLGLNDYMPNMNEYADCKIYVDLEALMKAIQKRADIKKSS